MTNVQEIAMFRQTRPANERFLITVPVHYGTTNCDRLDSTLGQQLARGLYADAGNYLNSDYITFLKGGAVRTGKHII